MEGERTLGCNYYLKEMIKPPCECCGRPFERTTRHIGKSSVGWCFLLHVYPNEGIRYLQDWLPLLSQPGYVIEDEYGTVVEPDEILAVIERRGQSRPERTMPPPGYPSLTSFYRANYAQPGPRGFLRAQLLEGHCIGHGDGAWDYIIGEFS